MTLLKKIMYVKKLFLKNLKKRGAKICTTPCGNLPDSASFHAEGSSFIERPHSQCAYMGLAL